MWQKNILLIVTLIVSMVNVACLDFTKEKPKKPAKKPTVNLPARPDLNVRHPSEKYVDDSYSIEGLINNLQAIKGKKIHLTGYVVGRSLCPKNEEVACTIEPSILLADYTKGPSKKIRVFVRPGEESRLETFQLRLKVSLSGMAKMVSPKGTVIEMDGLFVLSPVPVSNDVETTNKKHRK